MQLTLTRKTIEAALKRLGPALPLRNRAGLPVLCSVLVSTGQHGITLRATDLDLDITIGISGTVIPGPEPKALFDLRAAARFAKTLPTEAEVVITWGDNTVTYAADATRITMTCDDVKEYPRERGFGKTGLTKQDVDFTALGHVLGAASTDDARPILTGVNVAGNEYAATDSYRLNVCTSPTAVDKPFLLPGRAAKILAAIGGVRSLTFSQHMSDCRYQAEGYSLTSTLLNGEFPPYQRLIPDQRTILLQFEDEDFATGIARISTLARSFGLDGSPIRFEGDPIVATVKGGDMPWRESSLQVTFLGSCEMAIAFNHRYLTDATKGANVTAIEGSGPLKPCLVRWEDDVYKHLRLIMPVRVS